VIGAVSVMRCVRWALLLFLLPGLAHGTDGPKVQTDAAGRTIDVVGLSAADLAAVSKAEWKAEEWRALFAVYVAPKAGQPRGPALLGSYRVASGVVRFQPLFPLVRGVHYQAEFAAARVPTRAALHEKPLLVEILLPRPRTAATVVTQVYPTADRLPENLLKFYLHFSAPMSRGETYRHLKLLDENGKAVDLPFLELEQELWDGAAMRLTVFCDPGRIKRGLKPREEFGPVLEEGKRYTLVIDRGLEDANGNPLGETFRKTFQATAPDATQPDPKTWRIKPPAGGTRAALIVSFPKPLDHALLERMIWIADSRGRKLAGTAAVSDKETVWQFTPERAWQAGEYQLVADTRLEDLAGNSIARPFEVDVFHPVQREVKAETVTAGFSVP
jgi:hypothetical protein